MREILANNWEVSVVGQYGSDEGLLELAVLKDGKLHYENPVADGDVRGWLTFEQVAILSAEVASWQPNQTFTEQDYIRCGHGCFDEEE